jgi:hypothetical protein
MSMTKYVFRKAPRASGLTVYKQAVEKLHAPQQFAKEMAALGFPEFEKNK